MNIAWHDQARRVNGDGDADPNGDFHLTDFRLAYDDSAAIFDYDTQSILQAPAVFLNSTDDGRTLGAALRTREHRAGRGARRRGSRRP